MGSHSAGRHAGARASTVGPAHRRSAPANATTDRRRAVSARADQPAFAVSGAGAGTALLAAPGRAAPTRPLFTGPRLPDTVTGPLSVSTTARPRRQEQRPAAPVGRAARRAGTAPAPAPDRVPGAHRNIARMGSTRAKLAVAGTASLAGLSALVAGMAISQDGAAQGPPQGIGPASGGGRAVEAAGVPAVGVPAGTAAGGGRLSLPIAIAAASPAPPPPATGTSSGAVVPGGSPLLIVPMTPRSQPLPATTTATGGLPSTTGPGAFGGDPAAGGSSTGGPAPPEQATDPGTPPSPAWEATAPPAEPAPQPTPPRSTSLPFDPSPVTIAPLAPLSPLLSAVPTVLSGLLSPG